MYNISFMKEPYEVMMKGKWEAAEDFFDRTAFSIVCPMTIAKDTAFHIAVHNKDPKLLKRLLERVDRPMQADVFTTNAYGNTVLHEAAINCNIEAVKLLVEEGYVTQEQLLKRNRSGQTPLFKAASFGSTKVVKYLASQPNKVTDDNKLHEAHRTRNDKTSILHAAVRGEHFGTAITLLSLDEGLAELKTKNGMTSLCLLTNIQTTFSSKYRKQFWQRLVYLCIPTGDDYNDDAENIDDEPVQRGDNQSKDAHPPSKICEDKKVNFYDPILCTIWTVLQTINKSIWKYFIRAEMPTVKNIWKEKRKRKFAFELARRLIKHDNSWQTSITEDTIPNYRSIAIETEVKPGEYKDDTEIQIEVIKQETEELHREPGEYKDDTEIQIEDTEVETPLLAATRTGMIEIVREILKVHPQAVEHINRKKQNILHVAASYRQREVFELVKEMQIPTSRLILGIDEQSYTVLQHVADTENYTGGTRPGPAYQLQEELEWFKMVEDIMPSFFTKHRDKKNRTAEELFKEKHEKQLKDAQKWIKETSQSCSAVAVLVATIVFAAAFTVPGGTDENNGLPILLDNPFFLFFTVSDVVSLSSSLTSVVMFLSVLTSPFELDNFRVSLPRRLTLGFALLFISVATTMLAFTSTVFLIIRLDERRRWPMTLICCAAFFPVSVLALTHFPLFISFILAWKNLFKAVWEAPPRRLVVGCLTSVSKRLLSRKKGN